jgi:hypothetical protein
MIVASILGGVLMARFQVTEIHSAKVLVTGFAWPIEVRTLVISTQKQFKAGFILTKPIIAQECKSGIRATG